MIQFKRMHFDDTGYWYLFFSAVPLPSLDRLQPPPTIQTMGKRRRFFFFAPLNALIKIKRDKYSLLSSPLRWFGRVIVQERLLAWNEGHREFKGNRIYMLAGLNPVRAIAWGVALNPFNPFGSVYIMEHITDTRSARNVFAEADAPGKRRFLNQFCEGVIRLARQGYYNRDLHLGNVLIDRHGRFVWIDTHLHRLPFHAQRRRVRLLESVLRKVKGDENKCYVRDLLEREL